MKKNRISIICSVVFAFVCVTLTQCGGGSSSGEKIELKLNLTKGQVFSLEMSTDQEISQKIMGRRMDINQQIKLTFDFKVLEADDTGYNIEVVYKGVAYHMEGPTGTVSYDSEDPPDVVPQLAKGFEALVGQSFTMELSPKGDVLDVSGVDLIVSRMVDNLNLPSGAQKDMIKNQMQQQFGDESLISSMEGVMSIYPEKPVGIGDSWKKRFIMGGPMPMVLKNKWKLKDRKNGIAHVHVESDVEPSTGGKPVKMGMISINYEISGDQEGTIQIEESTGWTIEAEIEQNMKGKVKAMGQSWPISIKGIVTLKSKTI